MPAMTGWRKKYRRRISSSTAIQATRSRPARYPAARPERAPAPISAAAASCGTATPISSATPGSTHPVSGVPASQPSGMPKPSRISPAPPYTAAAPVRPSSPARAQGCQPRRAAVGGRGAAVTPGTPPDRPCSSSPAGISPITASAANAGTSAPEATGDAGAAACPYHWSTAMLALSSTHMTRPAPASR